MLTSAVTQRMQRAYSDLRNNLTVILSFVRNPHRFLAYSDFEHKRSCNGEFPSKSE